MNDLDSEPEPYVPKLVERCRMLGLALEAIPDQVSEFASLKRAWITLGIAESINPPEGRS